MDKALQECCSQGQEAAFVSVQREVLSTESQQKAPCLWLASPMAQPDNFWFTVFRHIRRDSSSWHLETMKLLKKDFQCFAETCCISSISIWVFIYNRSRLKDLFTSSFRWFIWISESFGKYTHFSHWYVYGWKDLFFFPNNSPTIFFQVGYDMGWPKRTESFPVGEHLLYNTLVRYRFCTLAGFAPVLSKVPSFHLIKTQKRLEVFFSWVLDGASLKGLHNPLLQFTDSTCWCMHHSSFSL